MESLFIKGTQETPEVKFDYTSGKFSITGRSYNGDTPEFYKPINAWLDTYLTCANKRTVLEVNVDYFHSVSVKFLTNLIKKLATLNQMKKTFEIIWFHEDDDDENRDLGKSIEIESKVKFEYIAVVE